MHRYGLIGYPIEHSLSPRLFGAAFGGRLPYDLIEGGVFEESWQRFVSSYQAINITAPFKENAFRAADIITDECRAIGATNLCVKTPDGIKAYNSDFRGVRMLLAGKGFSKGHKALVVGYGGAGKAAAAAARDLGMEVSVCNRTAREENILPLSEIPSLAPESDIVIYTLPGLVPEMEGIRPKCILEANYRDPVLVGSTSDYIDGRQWLAAQAVTGYELMTGEIPDKLAILQATI